MDVFNDLLPDYMLIENVPAMANTYLNVDGEVLGMMQYIESRLPYDFDIEYKTLNAKNFNTPQSRKRFIGLISKIKIIFNTFTKNKQALWLVKNNSKKISIIALVL